MTTRTRAGASARKPSRRRAPRKTARSKTATPHRRTPIVRRRAPRREDDPSAKKTGRRRNYYTAEFLAEAKRRIEQTLQSTASIARDFGMRHEVLARLVRLHGWVRPEGSLRRRSLSPVMRIAAAVDALVEEHSPAHSCESGNPATDAQASEPGTLGPRVRGDERIEAAPPDLSAIERFESAVIRELSAVERMRASMRDEPLRPVDAERTARTLSVLTETLAKLRRLRLGSAPQPGPDHDDDIPDIDAFRLDLARRIEAFVASQPDDECPEEYRAVAVEPPAS
jgi:hypothetical protein